MTISRTDFAAAVGALRSSLIQTACRLRRCNYDDAEDLVSEVILCALARLPEYDQSSGAPGLRSWLTAILYHMAQRDFRGEALQVQTEPLLAAETMEDAEGTHHGSSFDEAVQALPPAHSRVVADWLDGYGLDDIARRNRLHRNTVTVRLGEAFDMLRWKFPDAESLAFSHSLFAFCSRVTIYRRPKAPWRPWAQQHPPERSFRHRVQSGQVSSGATYP